MRHIDLHILQSVPPSCLNRDQFGVPKTAIFGGVVRGRVSSQCWKRAIREMAQELLPQAFSGLRTKRNIDKDLTRCLLDMGLEEGEAILGGMALSKALGRSENDPPNIAALEYQHDCAGEEGEEYLSGKEAGKHVRQKCLLYTSPIELTALARHYKNALEDFYRKSVHERLTLTPCLSAKRQKPSRKKNKEASVLLITEKLAAKAIKALHSIDRIDAADISLFGRMVASAPSMTLEGAAMFSPAISVNVAEYETDFFTALDERQPADELGADLLGTMEYMSNVYYRFIGINLDMLADEYHLGAMPLEQRKLVLTTFIRACLMAMPPARRHTMNANALPSYVLAVYQDCGYPIQFVNAFEKPVCPVPGHGGLVETAVERLKKEYVTQTKLWGLVGADYAMPEMTCDEMIARIVSHVR